MKLIFTLLGCALLAACAAAPGGKPINRLPKYQAAQDVARFGDWFIEPGSCTARAATADFTASTDGTLHGGFLPVSLAFTPRLVRPPLAQLSGLAAPLPLDGTGKNFTVYLLYDSTGAAYMLRPHTFLTVQYEALTQGGATLEANLATRGLLQALAHIVQSCR